MFMVWPALGSRTAKEQNNFDGSIMLMYYGCTALNIM